ncbi:hypothetical protein RZN22_09645 [Bacillaceae bacterium S4-13-58]
MADKYERLQCPLNKEIPEQADLYKYVIDQTGGKGIGEFLRSLIRLHREGRLILTQLNFEQVNTDPVIEEDTNYMDNLVL